MSSIHCLNPKAEVARAAAALELNISGARGLQEVMRSNLGPKGTLKMLVSGAGDIKITKDGNVLLHEMHIQHPTASMIAKASTAQDDITGDGTTSTVLLIGELLKQADIYIAEGLHPRVVVEGFELAKVQSQLVLDKVSVTKAMDRDTLVQVARTTLRTKLHHKLADHVTEAVVDSVMAIHCAGQPIDLHMVEIQDMQHRTDMDTSFVKGIVMDHGARHPDMPKRAVNAYIMILNMSLEYEKTEVNSGFFYKSAGEREQLIAAERQFIDERVQKIVDFKKKVCDEETAKDKKERGFVIVNQKGIDPTSLDALAKAGIMALRRSKRRNMERLQLACGGDGLNALDDVISVEQMGRAGLVYEHVLGEEKYTFVEDCENARSVSLLIKGPNKHSITQIKDAVNDGLRAVKNALDDGKLVPGAGAFEIAANEALTKYASTIKGRARLGVQAFADALLVIPKTLASNAGLDPQDVMVKLQEEHRSSGLAVGLDMDSGEPIQPADLGVWDNYIVKKNMMSSCSVIATNLLLVDEVMRAGMSSLKG